MIILKKYLKKTFIEKYYNYICSYIPYQYRILDKEFYAFSKLLVENEKKSLDEILQYQFNKLRIQIEKVYRTSEFYRKKYNVYGFNPCNFKDLSDIVKIPLLTKDEVRESSEKMLVCKNTKDLLAGYTSGTTGKPLKLYSDSITRSREWASICYQWNRLGYNPGDGRIEFRGFVENDYDYIELPRENVLRINIIKLGVKNIKQVYKKIIDSKYKFIHGYPTAIYKFIRLLIDSMFEFKPKGIFLASEVVYDWQLSLIDQYFSEAKKIAHYGQAEKIVLGAWDLTSRKYHFIPSYGFIEFDNYTNEIIGTGFINEAMPLIRYKMTDTACGINFHPAVGKTLFPIVEQIHGRLEDYTYNSNGDLIPPAIVTFPFKQLIKISSCKIIQHQINEFELIIEGASTLDIHSEVQQLIFDLKKIYGFAAKFQVSFIDKIPSDPSGKFRWIECKISRDL